MKFQQKLKKYSKDQLWSEYCGFLDIDLREYMYIQNRLMEKQVALWSESKLGRGLLKGKKSGSVEAFRKTLPLTSYENYADVLLAKKADMLPAEPIIWLQTTWEGGVRPVKLVPYTREMLDRYRHNIIAVTMLASGRGARDFNVKNGDRVLYGGAPLPYITGLLPSVIKEDIDFIWLPDTNENSELSFSERIKTGFKMAMSGGVDYFFAIGSVASYITDNFGRSAGGSGKVRISPLMALKYLRAKYIAKRDNRQVVPGDLFKLKGFVSTGTDAKCYKDKLKKTWGVTPIDLAAGTESTCLGAGTWEDNGMVFFPDSCFYEFISEEEMHRNLAEPSYTPRTCLMDEVVTGKKYELVLSGFHGSAFMRYRIGDVYQCVDAGKNDSLPRFSFVDRVPTVIDIAGFTRITRSSIEEVLQLSKIGVGDWFAKKEFDVSGQPFLHMYIELTPIAQQFEATKIQTLTEHLTAYFKYFDSDYGDLKKLLNMDPLKITVLKYGTIKEFERCYGSEIPRINPSALDVKEIINFQESVGKFPQMR